MASTRASRTAARARTVASMVSHTGRRLAGRPSTISLGDSHAGVLTGRPRTVVATLGPVTMHRAGRSGELDRLMADWVRRKRPIWRFGDRSLCRPSDVLVLHFGEIDVRCHIGGFVAGGSDEDELLTDLADRFIVAVTAVRDRYGCTVVVAAVVPPSVEREDPEFPYVGGAEDRVRWTARLNELLGERARDAGLLLFSYNDEVAGPDGLLLVERSDGSVHIGDGDRTGYQQALDGFLSRSRA